MGKTYTLEGATFRLSRNGVGVQSITGLEIIVPEKKHMGIRLWGTVDYLQNKHRYHWRRENKPRTARAAQSRSDGDVKVAHRECRNCGEIARRKCSGNGECHLRVTLAATLLEQRKIEMLAAVLSSLRLAVRSSGGTFAVVGVGGRES